MSNLPGRETQWARKPQCYLTKKVRRRIEVQKKKEELKAQEIELKKKKPSLTKKQCKEFIKG